MYKIDPKSWKEDLPAFREKTDAFYKGELKKNDYKGFSGLYGSYAQKGGEASMLRLRMTAGRVTKEKMACIAENIRKYQVKRMHFTTCEAIQLHDLLPDALYPIMESVFDAGIITMGGGGDFPRNVMCSPLSGVEQGEYFDVMPYAQIAGEYLMNFIKAEKMPRKLKVCFSNSPKNLPHATFRDLGFVARENGHFDVYSAGGLGNNARLGVKVAEDIEPAKILYYIKAMWLTFRTYGNYENRGKARTRYMQEALGGPEKYAQAYTEKLEEVFASGEDLDISSEDIEAYTLVISKKVKNARDGEQSEKFADGFHVIEQKQEGLYAVVWHPIGGQPDPEVFCKVSDQIQKIEDAEMRMSPDESAYIINLTQSEAKEILALIKEDTAQSIFEASVSCIGAATCQIGLRDSQKLLRSCIEAVKEAQIPTSVLPQIHISGCPSSCGTHQIGSIGFRGAAKSVDGKSQSAYMLYVNGCEYQGKEVLGHEVGTILEEKIPAFLVEVGQAVVASNMSFAEWNMQEHALEKIAEKYL